MAFCSKCGQQVADGVQFCPVCGAAMEGAAAAPQAPNNVEENFYKMEPKNKFFNSIHNFFDYLDSALFFRHVFLGIYYLIALVCVVGALLLTLNTSSIIGYSANAFIKVLTVIIILFFGFIGIFYWIEKAKKLKVILKKDDDIIVIPLVADLTKNIGDFAGIVVGVGGFIIFFLIAIFSSAPFLPSLGTALAALLIGFLIMVSFRLITELYKAIASIANNTKQILSKL